MLSSFFSKSKPINFIMISIYMVFVYILTILNTSLEFNFFMISKIIGGCLMIWISMMLINIIVKKYEISNKNTFTGLIYTILVFVIYNKVENQNILIVNLLIMLAVLNVLSLKNQLGVKQKILNASICIGITVLFSFWNILYVVVIYAGVFTFIAFNYKNLIIPVIGFIAVYIMMLCLYLGMYDEVYLFQNITTKTSLNNMMFFTANNLWPTLLLIGMLMVFISTFLFKYNRSSTKIKPIMGITFMLLFISVLIPLINIDKNENSLLYIIIPLAIMGASFFELKIKRSIQEISLWFLMLLPIIIQLIAQRG